MSVFRDTLPIGTVPKQDLVYAWSPVTGLSNPEIANPYAAPFTTTTYIVTTKSAGGGCLAKDTVVVTAAKTDTTLELSGKRGFCFNQGDSAVLTVHPTNTFQWFRDDVAAERVRDTVYRITTAGTYYALFKDSLGCSVMSRKETIAIDTVKPGIRYPPRYAVINLPLNLEARKIGTNILWKPANSLNNPASFTPVFKGISEQLYTISMQTGTGCLTVDTQLVKTVKNVEIYVPAAFTPNNDGVNDLLRPILRGIRDISYFRVYNRGGTILFETGFDKSGWDGNFRGMPQQSQVIVWVLKCVGVDGIAYLKKGTSVLLR